MLFLNEDIRFYYEFYEIVHLSVTSKDICELLNCLIKVLGYFELMCLFCSICYIVESYISFICINSVLAYACTHTNICCLA
jgi:hypothetical protein